MIEERKKEDVVKCINGELYYLGDYANFLYEKLDEKDKEIERLQDMDKILRNENINLKLRINKAIEYINKNGILDLNGYDLLEILGSDKE